MSATDNMNPVQFYHGTNAKLEPGKDTIRVDPHPQLGPPRAAKRVYFTEDKATAAHLGKYVYTVAPTGDYEPDDGGMIKSFKSRQPLTILGREEA